MKVQKLIKLARLLLIFPSPLYGWDYEIIRDVDPASTVTLNPGAGTGVTEPWYIEGDECLVYTADPGTKTRKNGAPVTVLVFERGGEQYLIEDNDMLYPYTGLYPSVYHEGENIYVVYIDCSTSTPRLEYAYSTNGGKHWKVEEVDGDLKAQAPSILSPTEVLVYDKEHKELRLYTKE